MKNAISKFCFLIFMILIRPNVFAADHDYYFVVGGDTTFCKLLGYSTTAQGYLRKVEYDDMDGNRVVIEGKNNVPDVETFYIKGKIMDKIPLKANQPDGYIRYTRRVVDGTLKVYLEEYSSNTIAGTNNTVATGSYRFFIKMPDGKYYKINSKSNLNEVIIPFLKKCKAFTDAYSGEINDDEEQFKKVIELYNSLCGK